MSLRSCGNCRFFLPDEGQIGRVKIGRCRFNPPIGFPVPVGPVNLANFDMRGGFPATRETWWCGKWEQSTNGGEE